MITAQNRRGLETVPGPYQVIHVTSDGSGNILVDGEQISGTTVKLAVYQTTVLISLSGTDTCTIQLPAVAAAEGLNYFIRADADGGGVTIADEDDSKEWTDLSTTADGQYAIIQAQGGQWTVLKTDIA